MTPMGWMLVFWLVVFVLGAVNEYRARGWHGYGRPYPRAENLRVIE